MNDVFVYDHVRTPRGKGRPDGALHGTTPVRLAAHVLRGLRERNGFDADEIDDVGLGVVMPVGEQGADITRAALLAAGYGDGVTGYQLNRFCTSALDTLKMGHALIAAGQAEAVIGGGVESMSRVAIGSDGGATYTDPAIGRHHPYIPNGVAADLMATLGAQIIPRARLEPAAELDEPRRLERQAYMRRVNAEHESILDAITRQDAESARAAMRTHLSNSRERRRKAQAAHG